MTCPMDSDTAPIMSGLSSNKKPMEILRTSHRVFGKKNFIQGRCELRPDAVTADSAITHFLGPAKRQIAFGGKGPAVGCRARDMNR
jgi:hypothetical protein